MSAELIVYGLIAAGLVFWLRSVLGTRHGDERERPNLYVASNDAQENKAGDQALVDDDMPMTQAEKIVSLVGSKGVISVDNKTAETALIEISRVDKAFDVEHFLTAAQDAFAIIVESFADGDREALEDMLAPPVYDAFNQAIKEREDRDEKQQAEIHAISKAEILEANLEKKMAYITVRFTAKETSVTYDKDGKEIAGHPDKVTEMKDVWVFGREAKSRDPRWFVFETKGDFDGDNELLPNSDE